FVPFNEIWFVTVTNEQAMQLLRRYACENGGISDLVAVQMQNRQHRAVANRVEKFVRVPGSRQRPGLRLTVADYRDHEQVGIIERRTESMREAVTELAALMDRPRCLGRAVAADSAGEGEKLEEVPQTLKVLIAVGIDLRVGAFEIGIRQHRRGAVSRTGDVQHVEVVFLDELVEMDPHQALAGIGAPMTKEPLLQLSWPEGLAQERIVLEIKLPDREIIAGAPVSVDQVKFIGIQGRSRFALVHIFSVTSPRPARSVRAVNEPLHCHVRRRAKLTADHGLRMGSAACAPPRRHCLDWLDTAP